MTASLTPVLTPHGHLLLAQADDAPELPEALSERLQRAFARGHGHGLLQLGAGEVKTQLPTLFVYWREFGARYVTAVCTLPDTGDGRAVADVPPLPADEVDALALSAPSDDGGRISDVVRSSGALGCDRRGVPSRIIRVEFTCSGLSQTKELGLESGRTRPLQPRRKPQRR